MSLPDFNGMSDDEIVRWVNGYGLVEVMRSLPNQADTFSRPTEIHIRPEDEQWLDGPTKIVALRLPESAIREVDALAGRDKEGRSGVIRAALYEYLRQHRGDAA